jgi:misacylated tRNA(Ala) deacylase
MRMHTCLHLLSALVPGAITGAALGDTKGRIDLDAPEPLDKERLAADLKRVIAEDRPVRSLWITDAELAAKPELVRTMTVKPPTGQGRVRLIEVEGTDLQPCGGTHVRSTGEIGAVRIGKIDKKGRHNRRINVLFED